MGLEDFIYNPLLGTFYNPKGKRIGSYTKKYGRMVYQGKEIKLHRLAFFLLDGEWPPEEIDHINGDVHDNRWSNLRKCSREENSRNKRKYVTNKSGFKGVYPSGDKYGVKIQVNGHPIYLGLWLTPELAAQQYDKAAKHYHGEFANLNYPQGELS